jgi:hypothetical protein
MKTNIVDRISKERDQRYYDDTAEIEGAIQNHHESPKIDHSFAFAVQVKDNVYLADLFAGTS